MFKDEVFLDYLAQSSDSLVRSVITHFDREMEVIFPYFLQMSKKGPLPKYFGAQATVALKLKHDKYMQAARKIQKSWEISAYDPSRSLCRSRLTKKFDEMNELLS